MLLPLFSYPTTVVWIDDDSLFLSMATQLLKDTNLITFNLPEQSIKYFQQYKPLLQKINFTRGCTELDNYDTLNHMPVDLNISAIKQLYSNSKRFQEVSVLVVDYNMLGMNGIDLCYELRKFPMKKILLTGDADYKQAVSAFNENLIDCYIQKDNKTLVQDILFNLNKLSKQYFIDQTQQLLKHLETDYTSHLSDPAFISFFEKWCNKNDIREYYLIDKMGNFLVINNEGKKSYFIVHTDRTLNNFIELHYDDKESNSFIDDVSLRAKIPFFGEGIESWELQPSQVCTCFYSAEVLIGQQKYYWAIAN